MHLTDWKIVHYDEYGSALGEVYPENLAWGLFLNKACTVVYDIDLANPISSSESTGPYRTDFQVLRRGHPLGLSGYHTEINIDEEESTFLKVAGIGWLHYFEELFWPHIPASPLTYKYTAAATDLFTILSDLWTIYAGSPKTDVVPFTFVKSPTLSGQVTNYKVDPGDTAHFFAKLEELSKIAPGFDYDADYDSGSDTHYLYLYAPRKGITTDFTFELHRNCELVNYSNRGHRTTLVAYGTNKSQKLAYVNSIVPGTSRRYEFLESMGDFVDQASFDEAADAQFDRNVVPFKQFSIRWYQKTPEDDLLDDIGIGDVVPVTGHNGYENVDGEYRVVSIEGTITDEANEEYIVSFDDGTLSL